MAILNPYLNFNGNAREAMEFYRSVFGGELKINTFGEFGNTDPAVADRVIHANLDTPRGYRLMASDTGPGMTLNRGNNLTCSLSGDPGEGLEDVWEKLSDGGEEGPCGWVRDRYGLSWQVVPRGMEEMLKAPESAGANRAMGAMMQMKKIDMAALERAFAG